MSNQLDSADTIGAAEAAALIGVRRQNVYAFVERLGATLEVRPGCRRLEWRFPRARTLAFAHARSLRDQIDSGIAADFAAEKG